MSIESYGPSMLRSIRPMEGIEGITPKINEIKHQPGEGQKSFVDFLSEQIGETNQLGLEADRRVNQAIRGEEVNPHATMIALQEADTSFKLMLSVKEKLIQTYEQLMRTQVG